MVTVLALALLFTLGIITCAIGTSFIVVLLIVVTSDISLDRLLTVVAIILTVMGWFIPLGIPALIRWLRNRE